MAIHSRKTPVVSHISPLINCLCNTILANATSHNLQERVLNHAQKTSKGFSASFLNSTYLSKEPTFLVSIVYVHNLWPWIQVELDEVSWKFGLIIPRMHISPASLKNDNCFSLYPFIASALRVDGTRMIWWYSPYDLFRLRKAVSLARRAGGLRTEGYWIISL